VTCRPRRKRDYPGRDHVHHRRLEPEVVGRRALRRSSTSSRSFVRVERRRDLRLQRVSRRALSAGPFSVMFPKCRRCTWWHPGRSWFGPTRRQKRIPFQISTCLRGPAPPAVPTHHLGERRTREHHVPAPLLSPGTLGASSSSAAGFKECHGAATRPRPPGAPVDACTSEPRPRFVEMRATSIETLCSPPRRPRSPKFRVGRGARPSRSARTASFTNSRHVRPSPLLAPPRLSSRIA